MKRFTGFMFALLAIGLASCGGIDDKKLDGTWLETSHALYINGISSQFPTKINESGEIVTIRDGRLKIQRAAGGFFSSHAPRGTGRDLVDGVKVKLDGSKLLFGENPDKDDEMVMEVTELDEKKMAVRRPEPEIGGMEAEFRSTFRRITEDKMKDLIAGK